MRYFNTAGVCLPDWHYMLPPEPRLPEARRLIEQGHYFVVHAPRQTGKTTTLTSLARTLTAEGRYAVVYATCERGRAVGDDYAAAQRGILASLRARAELDLPPELQPPPWPEASDESLLSVALTAWAQACPRPLVLLLDEIDALAGPSLLSILSQLRDGAAARPGGFPHSVAVCGLRDVRDYYTAAGGDASRMGGASPFNIKIDSLRLGDFTLDEVRELYGQHTADTGQSFTEETVRRAFHYSQGQPWLVNALAREIVEKLPVAPPEPILPEHVEAAKERLILARASHLDSLVAKLYEERVQRIIEPLIAGELPEVDGAYNDDVSYLRDLGLIALGKGVRVANPIYKEVIVRVLGEWAEDMVTADPRSFVRDDGTLAFRRLLEEFVDFWCQHGEILDRQGNYHEVAPQLVLMGFLHRIVNGGGQVDREYGLGRGRIDLIVRWPYTDADGKRAEQREAMELKVWRRGADPLERGLIQLDEYLDRMRVEYGTLVIFDRRRGAPPPHERTAFDEARTRSGRPVTLLWA